MLQTAGSPARLRIPPLIKRNTALVALSQSFSGAGMPLAYGIGPLMVVAVTGSASLAGLVGRAVRAEPVPGVLSGRQGHRRLWPQARHPARARRLRWSAPLIVAWSMSLNSIVGAHRRHADVRHGHGGGASVARRRHRHVSAVAARREALGYRRARLDRRAWRSARCWSRPPSVIAPGLGQDPMALPWLMLPVLIVAGMVLVTFVRPDPKEIGQNLAQLFSRRMRRRRGRPAHAARHSAS